MTAIKKEYSFGFSMESVEIAEEEHKLKVLTGERVAFSAYGKVSTLQGFPVTEGSVLAKNGDSIEQTTLKEDGTFRVMGLQPNIPYTFTVESTAVDRSLPGSQEVTIQAPSANQPNSDVTDLRFVAIERAKTMSVAGSAFFEGEESSKEYKALYKEVPLLTVTLYKSGSLVRSIQLPVSHLFEFKDVPRGTDYELVVKSNKPMVDRRHETQVTIPLEGT